MKGKTSLAPVRKAVLCEYNSSLSLVENIIGVSELWVNFFKRDTGKLKGLSTSGR